MTSNHKQPIILLAHGSPEKYAKKVLISIKKKLSGYFEKKRFALYHAFLQFNKPDLESCLKQVLKSTINNRQSKIVILPVFISHGRHTLFDVPKIIKNIKKKYRGVKIKVALPFGSDDLLVRALYKQYKKV